MTPASGFNSQKSSGAGKRVGYTAYAGLKEGGEEETLVRLRKKSSSLRGLAKKVGSSEQE